LVQAVKDFDGVQELQVVRLKGDTWGTFLWFFGDFWGPTWPHAFWLKKKRGEKTMGIYQYGIDIDCFLSK